MRFSYDTHATRRHLPHFDKSRRTFFVTFSTIDRRYLPPAARSIAMDCIIHDHDLTYCLECAVIMTDHAHMVFSLHDDWTLTRVMRRVKGVSSRLINQELGARGSLWQDESFDRLMRCDEDVRKKCEYICQNPVRDGLAASVDEYPWIWRLWVEGGQTGLSVLHGSRVD
jgi:putative transposase